MKSWEKVFKWEKQFVKLLDVRRHYGVTEDMIYDMFLRNIAFSGKKTNMLEEARRLSFCIDKGVALNEYKHYAFLSDFYYVITEMLGEEIDENKLKKLKKVEG